MASFGSEIEDCKTIDVFVNETNERLKEQNLVNNPFIDSKAIHLTNTIAIHLKPVYPNYPLIAFFFIFFPILYFKGISWSSWYIPSIVFLGLSCLWSNRFLYFIMKLGLRKKGYKGKIKLLNNNETIRRLINYGAK